MSERDYNAIDGDSKFWLYVWLILSLSIVSVILIAFIWNHFDNERRMVGWIECVKVNGQPLDVQHYGANGTTFTCIKK